MQRKPEQYGSNCFEHLLGGEGHRLAPTFDHDAAVFRIERNQQSFAVELGQKLRVDAAGLECRGADDDFVGALLDELAGTLRGADAAADAAAGARGQEFDQRVVGAASHGGIQVDDLYLREGLEAFEHFGGRAAFERLVAPLHELDDLAVH